MNAARLVPFTLAALFACGPRTPAAFPEPTEDPNAPPPPPAPVPPSNHVWSGAEVTCNAKASSEALRLRFEDEEPPSSAERGPWLGISSPPPPVRPRVKMHVRRLPARAVANSALDPDLAKAIDAAPYDTTRCAEHEGASADLVVEITVDKGAVSKVTSSSKTDAKLTRCLLEVACELRVPTNAAEMRAAIPLRVQDMKSGAPKLELVSQESSAPAGAYTAPADASEPRENDPAILGGVLREAAVACEQGQLLAPAPRFAVFLLSASPHSSVAPTVNVAFGPSSKPAPHKPLLECMRDRMEGFRLPLSPWHGVGQTGFRVTWDG